MDPGAGAGGAGAPAGHGRPTRRRRHADGRLARRSARTSLPHRQRPEARRARLLRADDRRRGAGATVTGGHEDRQLIAAFLEMMAAEAGAARNTLLAYERDLRGASDLLEGGLGSASDRKSTRLGAARPPVTPAAVPRKDAALRRRCSFLAARGPGPH